MRLIGYFLDFDTALEAVRRRQRPRNELLRPLESWLDSPRQCFLWFGDTPRSNIVADEHDVPELAIVPDSQLREFVARLLTLGDAFPITSVTRVLPSALRSYFLASPRTPDSRRGVIAVRSAVGELIEVSTVGSHAAIPSALSVPRQIRSCFLWVAAQSSGQIDPSVMLTRWERAQSLARISSPTRAALFLHRRLAAAYLAVEHEVLRQHSTALEVLETINAERWDHGVRVALDLLGSADVPAEGVLSGSLERRVAVAVAVLNMAANMNVEPLLKAIASALILAAITKGSMDYLHIAARYSNRYPGICIWYGLLSALGESPSSNGRASPLEHRLVRAMGREFEGWPSIDADIGLEELEILASSSTTKIRALNALTSLDVELLPAVTVPIRWQDSSDAAAERGRGEVGAQQQLILPMAEGSTASPSGYEERLDEVASLLAKAMATIKSLREGHPEQSAEQWPKRNRNRKPASGGKQ